MAFDTDKNLRYHALWGYVGITSLALFLDKIPLPDWQALVAILAPVALVIGADVSKHRND